MSWCSPARISSHVLRMSWYLSSSSLAPLWLAFAAPFFKVAYAVIISRGIRSWPMLKCSSERCVCAPHSLSAGTSTTPRLSVSLRTSGIALLSQIKQIRTEPFTCDTEGDPDHGVDEPQQWLLPSVLRVHCHNHHYNSGRYPRCHDVATPT